MPRRHNIASMLWFNTTWPRISSNGKAELEHASVCFQYVHVSSFNANYGAKWSRSRTRSQGDC